MDTARTIEIAGSPMKLLGIAAGALVFVALGFMFVLGYLPPDGNIVIRAIGVVCIAFFGLCLVVALARLFGGLGTVVTVSPQGIRDSRVTADVVPWHAIADISTWGYEGTRVIVLAIDPAAEQQFTMTPVARWTRGVNAGLGADGLSVSTTDLRIDHDTLLDIVTAYWQAYRAR